MHVVQCMLYSTSCTVQVVWYKSYSKSCTVQVVQYKKVGENAFKNKSTVPDQSLLVYLAYITSTFFILSPLP